MGQDVVVTCVRFRCCARDVLCGGGEDECGGAGVQEGVERISGGHGDGKAEERNESVTAGLGCTAFIARVRHEQERRPPPSAVSGAGAWRIRNKNAL